MTLSEVAQKLKQCNGARASLPALALMTDSERLADPVAAIKALPCQALVLFRHYDLPTQMRQDLAARLCPLAQNRGHRFLVAADPKLAEAIGADGVHWPEYLMPRSPLWRAKHPSWVMTGACHSEGALRRAKGLGLDGAMLSPLFPTASHPGKPTLGLAVFSRLARQAKLPIYALGGINNGNAQRLTLTPAIGIAGISGLV